MSGAISAAATQPQAQRAIVRSVQSERLFYVVAGSVMLIATVVGFRAFLAHGKAFGGGEITRQIVPLVVVHGVAMFSWVCLFLVQSVFILNGNRRLHMRAGVGGAVLAGVVVILGSVTAILSTRDNPAGYQILGGARFFLATMLGEMLAFSLAHLNQFGQRQVERFLERGPALVRRETFLGEAHHSWCLQDHTNRNLAAYAEFLL